jgi:aldose sugar dehydrogenase
MRRKGLVLLISLLFIAVLGPLAFYLLRNSQVTENTKIPDLSTNNVQTEYEIVEVVRGLTVPWNIAFTSTQRFLVTERTGSIRVVENGELVEQPLITFPETSSTAEEGLMGLAVDPFYLTNRYVYVAVAYTEGQSTYVKVTRIEDEGNSARVTGNIIDKIPASRIHAGGALRFGPDNKLYITTGDAASPDLAQDLNSLAGKILRLNPDGTIPEDNPFPNSPVWSYGHRNSQGIDWHPQNEILYSTEHGPSGNDGPPGGDEINLIEKGQNYGWPLVSHERTREGTVSPIQLYTPAEAPSSGTFYSSTLIPQFQNNFFFGALRGEGLHRVIFSEEEPRRIEYQQKIPEVNFGRIRAVTEGPDGALYFATSNRDGRGNPRQGDDKIFKIIPVN